MKTFSFSLLLASLAAANPVDLVKRADSPSDICTVQQKQGSICAKQGSLATPKVLRTINVALAEDCISAVHVAPRAISGRFTLTDSNVNQCTLYTATLANQGYSAQGGSSNSVYFDKACLSCRPCALGFMNGGFELQTLRYWQTFGSTPFKIIKPGYLNTKAAANSAITQVSSGSSNINFQNSNLLQDFEVCLGTKYNIAGFVKALHTSDIPENSTYSIKFGILNDQPGGNPSVQITNNFTNTYQRISFQYTPARRSTTLALLSSLQEIEAADASFNVSLDSVTVTPA